MCFEPNESKDESACACGRTRGNLLLLRFPAISLGCSHLTGLDVGFESRLQWNFSGSSHTSDLKIGTPVATLPGAWHYRVSAGTGWPGVSIL